MPAAERQIEIDAPPDAVMAVITDFSAYPDFLPEMERVEIVNHDAALPETWEVRFTLALIRKLVYTLRLRRDGPYDLSWSLVEGAFRSNDGGWHLEPLDGGSRTRATYRIDVQVGMFVPGSIVRSLVDRSLPDTLRRFKAEVERRA